MNKAELVRVVADKADLTQAQAAEAVNAVFAAVEEALAEGDAVSIPGFGVFSVAEHAARTGHNPATGATIQIPASKAPAFKASKTLKEKLN